jgi:hypothetical protein
MDLCSVDVASAVGVRRSWLEGASLAELLGSYLHRAPVARPAAAAAVVSLFDWSTLDRVLAAPDADVLVVARGELLALPAPRSLRTLRTLMRRGVGVVVRGAERCDAGLALLADRFAGDFGAEVRLQLFATPGGTHGFGWHHDAEHVFIAQTAGAKDYYFRANTVSPPHEALPDFALFRRERSPLATARLVAGDWLYLPARWWHMARCLADSLSVSIGVRL